MFDARSALDCSLRSLRIAPGKPLPSSFARRRTNASAPQPAALAGGGTRLLPHSSRQRRAILVAAETIAGAETMPVNYDMIPRATYCQPQIGSFGYSEQQAKDKGYDVKTAKFPFSANGKAHGLGEATGFVKIVADAKYGEILGLHMIGPDVTELLPELTLAQLWDLTADEVARNVHAHPTLSEALKEVAHGVSGHMINF